MTIGEAVKLGAQALAAVPDPRLDAELLLSAVTGMKRLSLLLNATQELTPEQKQTYRSYLHRRAQREPLQYILGMQCFYGSDLHVDAAVLIPRPETESLCEQALLGMEGMHSPAVADVCTGSGAIAIAIKKARPDAVVYATELSHDALRVAQANAKHSQADIAFLQGDLLAPLAARTVDIIVSNPPYIETAALAALQPEVRREPRMALDGGADGLIFYRRLATEAPACLNPGGRMYLEFGDGQAEQVSGIFAASGQFDALRVRMDLFGKLRILEARRKA